MPPRAEPGTPLYVHLPFCAAKCPYCDFYSVAGDDLDTGGVIEAVLREAERFAPRAPRTVFFGGGTPSFHSPDELRRLLSELERITAFRESAEEVTFECNPESLDAEKARLLVEHGVDRVSIGFQSLEPAVLELFGRVHTVDQSFRAYGAAREAGVPRIAVDLIYGAPGQGVDAWTRGLERVLALGPDHLSAYNLTFEPGTPFAQWLAEGKLAQEPEAVELELFERTRAIAASRGMEAYEVSNFASKGEECRHNLNYWRNGPYVGLGPSAVSKVGHTRRGRPRSIGAWRRALEGDGEEWAFEETLSPKARLGETWWLGLRLARGVDPEEARRAAGFVAAEGKPDPAEETAGRLAADGLLERVGERFRLTVRGLPLADRVATHFLEPSRE